MKVLLKALLYLFILALLAGVCFGTAWYNGWPWWAAGVVFATLAALVLGFGFLKRLFAKLFSGKRAERAMQAPSPPPARRVDQTPALLTQWKKGLATLKASSLTRYGNPVYTLPWYVVLGAGGSGKSSALQQAKLASSIQDVKLTGMVEPTQTLQWWFFDRAVMLDLSGRYCAVDADAQVQSEWKRFLKLLAGVRRREPLNGVVVTVGTDELLHGSPEKLYERMRVIRSRIDQLMRLTDARFPVYVVITKCDALFGLDDWAGHLLPEHLNQALGYVRDQDTPYAKEFLDNAFTSVAERLHDLRLVITREVENTSAGLLLFPNEFERLRPLLEQFFQAAFGEDSYMETPMLRGLFFTSARQGGGVESFVLKDTNLPDQTVMLMNREQSLFLRDVFSKVIPHDRWLFQPLRQALRWGRITRNLGLAAWLLACGVVGAYLTGSFVRGWSSVADLREAFPAVPQLTGKFAQDINSMTQHLQLLRSYDARTHDWLVESVPFNDSVLELGNRLRAGYVGSFQKYLLGQVDGRIARRLNPLDRQGEPSPTDIQYIVRRLNLIRAAESGQSVAALARLPEPAPTVADLARVHGEVSPYDLTPDSVRAFGELYRAYLTWQTEPQTLAQETKRLQGWLTRIALSSENLAWLAQWANEQPGMRPVTTREFWGGSRAIPGEATIPAAFTLAGKSAIDRFLQEIEKSAASDALTQRKAAFNAWYAEQRLRNWLQFAAQFDKGKLGLASEAEWKALLPKMATDKGPYRMLLARMIAELKDYGDDAPDWVKLVRRIDIIKGLGAREGLIGEANRVTGVITSSAPQLLREAISEGIPKAKDQVDAQLAAGKSFAAYAQGIAKAADDAQAGIGRATQVAAAFHQFGVDPQVKESALMSGYDALNSVKQLLGDNRPDTKTVWELLAGALTFVIQYADQQAACNLQDEWNKAVLSPLQAAATPADANDMLFGQKSVLAGFFDTTAKPFLAKGVGSYTPVDTLGFKVPFDDALVPFASSVVARQQEITIGQKRAEIQKEQAQAAEKKAQLEAQKAQQDLQKRLKEVDDALNDVRQQQTKTRALTANLVLHALPTNANREAKAHPYATVLTVQCAPEPKSLANYNFPASLAFTWSPQSCGDITLQIKVDDLTLTKIYPGATGMNAFLADFYDGERLFRPDDFPDQRGELNALGLRQISVRYQFAGHTAVLHQADTLRELKQKENELLAEKTKLQSRADTSENVAFKDKKDALLQQQDVLAERERALVTQAGFTLNVPSRITVCWEPSAEYLLAKVPTREIPLPKLAPKLAAPPKPQPSAPAAGGDWQIQLGAFGPASAKQLVATLRRDGLDPDVTEISAGGGTLYRVRIGRYASPEQAHERMEELNQRYNVVSAVVRYDPQAPRIKEIPAAATAAAPARAPQPELLNR
ncbi:MAG TPA: type VI secretion protein IcmF/TssM N-terminal domain-containing protein [Burkholderiales bacterium]|nr:type VI secretion protein IcmF/TssM N-terminal domain-containing protein [Burkholderiales bacterium]